MTIFIKKHALLILIDILTLSIKVQRFDNDYPVKSL